MKTKQILLAWILILGSLVVLGISATGALAASQEGAAQPASQSEPEATMFLVKERDSMEVMVQESVVYTLTIANVGLVTDTVEIISDTLPAGFAFEEMLDTGDVQSPPQIAGSVLRWTDPIVVPAGRSRQLAYQVRAGSAGFKQNVAEARTVEGQTLGPVSASVTVSPIRTYLPIMTYSRPKPVVKVLLDDDFGEGVSSDWTVFLNYPGLSTEDWYWYDGWYWYDPDEGTGWRGYALSMYLGEGSSEWTDYEVVLRLANRKENLAGLWLRGSYEAMNDNQGGRVGGYYLFIKPQDNIVYLFRLNPATKTFYDVGSVVAARRYGPGIGRKPYDLKVEVRGANIKVWMKEYVESDDDYRFLIDWTDPNETYMQGTIGLATFRTVAAFDQIKVTSLAE